MSILRQAQYDKMVDTLMNYHEVLNKLLSRESLAMTEAEQAMEAMVAGEYTPAQIAGLLVALRMKGETAEEIAGFIRSLRRHTVAVPDAPLEVFDTCGTGGDGMHSIFPRQPHW